MERIEAYAKSLIQDLQSDIKMLNVSQYQAEYKYHAIDRLRKYVSETPLEDLSNTDLFFLTRGVMCRTFEERGAGQALLENMIVVRTSRYPQNWGFKRNPEYDRVLDAAFLSQEG